MSSSVGHFIREEKPVKRQLQNNGKKKGKESLTEPQVHLT